MDSQRTERVVELSAIRREELRGLFILGMLAILWQSQGRFEEFSKSENIFLKTIPTLNYLLAVFWGAYAITMILGWSHDFLPEWMCVEFRSVATIFLQLSFGLVVMLSVIALVVEYGVYMLIAIATTFAVVAIRFVSTKRFKWPKQISAKRILEKLLTSSAKASIPFVILSLYLIAFGHRELKIPYLFERAVVGSVGVLFIAWLVYRKKWI